MTVFEPWTSGSGSDRSTNWATQPLPNIRVFSFRFLTTFFYSRIIIYAHVGFNEIDHSQQQKNILLKIQAKD